MSPDYTKETWRDDLRKLIRNAGSLRQDTILYVHGSELLRHNFLLVDVDSLMASGEVPGIFSTEEKHELNEVRLLQFYSNDKSKQTVNSNKGSFEWSAQHRGSVQASHPADPGWIPASWEPFLRKIFLETYSRKNSPRFRVWTKVPYDRR